MTRPVILYENLFSQGELSSQFIDPFGQPSLIANWLTYDGVTFEFITGQDSPHITVTLESPQSANCFAVARHNLGSNNETIRIRDGDVFGSIIAEHSPVDDSPFIVEFDDHSTDQWTLEVVRDSQVGAYVFISVFALGNIMDLERSAFLNVTPPGLNPSDEYNRNRSEAGQTMGLTLKRKGIQNEISFDNVSLEWIKDEWKPFTDHMRKKACFWAWDQDDNPLDVAFVERDGNPQANPTTIGGPNQQGYWQVSLPVKGIAE